MASLSPASVEVGLGSSLMVEALEAEPDVVPSSESLSAESELDVGPEVEVEAASAPESHGVVGVESYYIQNLARVNPVKRSGSYHDLTAVLPLTEMSILAARLPSRVVTGYHRVLPSAPVNIRSPPGQHSSPVIVVLHVQEVFSSSSSSSSSMLVSLG
ncbi:hypothetical protein BDV11DRAFT_60520 [Aspergillus similis]